ncbi:MAG: peptide ABC transporter substrate-binding protein [Deltaproteobacteria bacterium]|nr:peptide ABC transporter substrate-binding protein [Deltaproteobacteria bacterium]
MRIKSIFALVLLVFSTAAFAKTTNQQLVIGATQEFDTLNPMISQMAQTYYIQEMLRRQLTNIDADWKWVCRLCTQIPTFKNGMVKKITEHGKEKLLVTWELQPNTKWGDGTPLTGYDVKFSWQVGLAPTVSVGEREQYTQIEAITVDEKNPRRFTMKFDKPRYDYYQLGTFYIIPKHLEEPIFQKTKGEVGAYEKQSLYVLNPTNPGLYYGPYVVSEVKLGSHLTLIPNSYFHGEKPKIQKIIFKMIPNSQALEANLRSGSIDMIHEVADFTLDQAISLEKRLKADAPYEVLYRAGTVFEHIDLNLRNEVLQEARVRKALLYGIDREKLVQALFEGKYTVARHRVHPLDPNYSEKAFHYSYDSEKAKALLEEAGWQQSSDGIRSKEGKKLSFVLMTTAGNKMRELVEVYLKEEWKKIGVDMQIKNEPARVFFGETVRKGEYPHMAMFAWISSPDNVNDSTLHSKNIPTAANGYSGQNTGAWGNAKMDQLLDSIYIVFDAAKRKKIWEEMMIVEMNDLPTIPLYFRSQIAVVPRNLENFRITGHQFYSSVEVEKWDLE